MRIKLVAMAGRAAFALGWHSAAFRCWAKAYMMFRALEAGAL